MKTHRPQLLLLALLAWAGNLAHATDYTWRGTTSSSWSVPTNWEPVGVPGTNDSALVGGFVDGSGNITVSNLTLTTSGRLVGGNFTVLGTMTWTGGGVSSASLTIAVGGTLNLSGADAKELHLSALTNLATAHWTGTGLLSVMGSPIVNDGTFEFQADADLLWWWGDASTWFRNNGQVRKIAGSGTNTLGMPFHNSGTMEARSGTVLFRGGTGTGRFHAETNATVAFTYQGYTDAGGLRCRGASKTGQV